MKTTVLLSAKNYQPVLTWVLILFTSIVSPTFAQEASGPNYRNIDSYLADFAKNELFIKKSLIDYSNSIMENHAMARATASSVRIVEKLKRINVILRKFDKGFKNDTSLRDGFIRMNEKTIECMTNGTLIMNDYELQSQKDMNAVRANLTEREQNVIAYFNELKAYEDIKQKFSTAFNICIKGFNGNNLFEYNAYQNVMFYKMNVIDQKIIASINCINKDDFNASVATLDQIFQDVMNKTTDLSPMYNDVSLNEANIAYSKYIYNQKEVMVPLFNDFYKEYEDLQAMKASTEPETSESIALYNAKVRSYNATKNKLYDYLRSCQVTKTKLCNKWFSTNRDFLVNNIKVENIYENYVAMN